MNSPEQIAHIQAQFPQLADRPYEINREGLVNDVMIIDGERVFRFPKNEQGWVVLEQELKVLDQHGIGPSATVRSRQDWLELYRLVQKDLYPFLPDHAHFRIESLFKPVLMNEEFLLHAPALMNGDIGTYHMLFDETTSRIKGMIDFGTAGRGDPAADIACLLYQYGERLVARVANFYPEVMEMIDRARFWAGTLELQWALAGLRQVQEADCLSPDVDWSWFTVHIGLSGKDIRPIGTAL